MVLFESTTGLGVKRLSASLTQKAHLSKSTLTLFQNSIIMIWKYQEILPSKISTFLLENLKEIHISAYFRDIS